MTASPTGIPRAKARYGLADQAIAIVSGLSFALVTVTTCTIPFINSIRLLIGQTSLFVLLGYVLFLCLHRSSPFWAGLSLWLRTLRPHLFLVIGVVLLAWVLTSRSYRILVGAAGAVTASCLVTSWIDPAAWGHYMAMMHGSGINKEAIPCVNIVLRQWLSPTTMWLQYVPAILGCGWGLSYFWQRRNTWDRTKDGSLVTPVSVLVAPHSWITDQALAIPSLLDGAFPTRSQILLVILAAASVLLEAELLGGAILASNFYLWTTPAWLVWYVLVGTSAAEPSIEAKSSYATTD